MRFALSLLLLAGTLHAQPKLENVPLPEGLVPPNTAATLGAVVTFLEGPAEDPAGNILFSDIAGNRILSLDPKGKLSVFRADSGQTNGNAFDAQGRLLCCEGAEMAKGRRQVTRTDLKSGIVQVLADKYEGKRFNSPNDVVVDAQGRIWFTDPRYGPERSDLEMDVEGVYRIDVDGKVTRVLDQKQIDRPNGIAVSPDNTKLYVVDSHPKVGGARKIWAFEIGAGGTLGKQTLVYDFGKGRGADGIRVDVQGNIWAAAGISVPRGNPGETLDVPPGVYVISPQGKLLGRISIPENLITNLCFAGPQRSTVYVTAGKTLYKFQASVAGYSVLGR